MSQKVHKNTGVSTVQPMRNNTTHKGQYIFISKFSIGASMSRGSDLTYVHVCQTSRTFVHGKQFNDGGVPLGSSQHCQCFS